jgi:hypothetical protein
LDKRVDRSPRRLDCEIAARTVYPDMKLKASRLTYPRGVASALPATARAISDASTFKWSANLA